MYDVNVYEASREVEKVIHDVLAARELEVAYLAGQTVARMTRHANEAQKEGHFGNEQYWYGQTQAVWTTVRDVSHRSTWENLRAAFEKGVEEGEDIEARQGIRDTYTCRKCGFIGADGRFTEVDDVCNACIKTREEEREARITETNPTGAQFHVEGSYGASLPDLHEGPFDDRDAAFTAALRAACEYYGDDSNVTVHDQNHIVVGRLGSDRAAFRIVIEETQPFMECCDGTHDS